MKVDWLEIINIIMIFQLLMFAVFLFLRKVNRNSNILFGIHLVAQAAGILHTLAGLQSHFFNTDNPHSAFIGFPFVFLWGPSFYLYVKSVSFSDFRITWIHILHSLPTLFLIIFFSFGLYFHSTAEIRIILNDPSFFYNANWRLIDILLRFQILLYVAASYSILFKVRETIKENYSYVEKFRFAWLKFIVIGYTVCFIISVTFIYTEVLLVNFNRLLYLGNFLQFFIYFNIIFFKAWSHPEIFHAIKEVKKYGSSRISSEDAELWRDKLVSYISEKKPYLNPELSLNELADGINLNPKLLSQIINEKFNQNFYDFINSLRIEESKKMLIDPSMKLTVLEILYDTGFNSKATFNRAFKKHTGISPTEFRNVNSVDSNIKE